MLISTTDHGSIRFRINNILHYLYIMILATHKCYDMLAQKTNDVSITNANYT